MRHHRGHSLLELLIALALASALFLVIDTVYSGLWLTRAKLDRMHDSYRLRRLPEQLFADLLYHAGHLGCRAVGEGISIQMPSTYPEPFFIHTGAALKTDGQNLWVQDTLSQQIVLNKKFAVGDTLTPVSLAGVSDWLLISDCNTAETVPYGGTLKQAYDGPVYISPVVIQRWYLKNKTLYRQQIYPYQSSVPIESGVVNWSWARNGKLISLEWGLEAQQDLFEFELGNS